MRWLPVGFGVAGGVHLLLRRIIAPATSPTMCHWAAIFDWDGVVIDSSRLHERAWQRLAAEMGRELPDDFFRRSFGMKNERAIGSLLEWSAQPQEIARLGRRKEEFYRESVVQSGIKALPGVVNWLNRLRVASVPCAIGSSAPKENIDCVLKHIVLGEYFRGMVCAEDVAHGKPDPEVFLTAARRLGAPPERCVVFEDAHVGIEAAHAARMKVVAVTSTHPPESLQEADVVVSRLDELTVPQVEAWFRTSV